MSTFQITTTKRARQDQAEQQTQTNVIEARMHVARLRKDESMRDKIKTI